jgi:hypothetical protein
LSVDAEMELADAMIRQWGKNAAVKASYKACAQSLIGNEEGAQRWRRVMEMIAKVANTKAKTANRS